MKNEQRSCTVDGCVCFYSKKRRLVTPIPDDAMTYFDDLLKMIKEKDGWKEEAERLSKNVDFWRKETNYWKGKRYSPENTIRLETGS